MYGSFEGRDRETASIIATREIYDQSMRTELDRIAELDFARKDGEAKGKAEVAKAMLKDGLKAEKVMAYTGLSKEEIQKLKK